MISKFWNHFDHDRSSSKFSNLIENLHINDEVEDKKVFKNTDDNLSFKESQERSLQFRRRSGTALDNQFEISYLLQYFINRKFRHRILQITKLKLVLEMKQQSTTLKVTWQKYFLKTPTIKSIVRKIQHIKILQYNYLRKFAPIHEDSSIFGLNRWKLGKV